MELCSDRTEGFSELLQGFVQLKAIRALENLCETQLLSLQLFGL